MNRWWQHESLQIDGNQLVMDDMPLHRLAQQHGTPLYIYSQSTVKRQLHQLDQALAQAVSNHKIYYAMKANRHPGVMKAVREMSSVGIDACSPDEVEWAIGCGFAAHEISFNAGMLSNRDLDALSESGVHMTLDSFSALRRYAARVPSGTAVGLRFNPATGAAYGESGKLLYANAKFGFEFDEAADALQIAQQAGLVVNSVHTHIGWGLPEDSASQVEDAFRRLAHVAELAPDLREINVGGGLGGRYQAKDQPLRLSTWSGLIAKHLAPLGVTVSCEPGTFVAAPAGVLVVEVNTVEHRRGVEWIGIDAGFSINPNPAYYDLHFEAVPVCHPEHEPVRSYTIAGHINEALDIWSKHAPLPNVKEGDLLAFVPAGAYGSSMASNHCLRGRVGEIAI